MKIAVIGSGYVGLVAGACFAQMGNSVTCLDIDKNKIASLKKGEVPIFEPNLSEIIKENLGKNTLHFTTNKKEALQNAEVIFIAVGTPMGEDGSADLAFVKSVAKDIGEVIQSYCVVVNKSTVPVGTAKEVREIIAKTIHARGKAFDFDVVSNPEFLKEGVAIKDFMSPDRIVIGTDSPKALNIMKALYSPFLVKNERLIAMSVESAEMTKYAANSMLATKISFINEMSQICERVGADINDVRLGIGSDSRIGYSFIYPGCGYGGSCFPKDVKALEKTAMDYGYKPKILSAIQSVNEAQKMLLAEKIIAKFGEDLSAFSFGIWGLAFKPETDDVREASSLTLIKALIKHKATIKAYDPKAINQAKFYLKDEAKSIEFTNDKYEALQNASALILLTEWKEFRSPDFARIKELLKSPIIFDGRNIYRNFNMKDLGFQYHQIGVKSVESKKVKSEK